MCNFFSASFFPLVLVYIIHDLIYLYAFRLKRCFYHLTNEEKRNVQNFSEKCVPCQLGCGESRLGSVNCYVKLRATSIKGMN